MFDEILTLLNKSPVLSNLRVVELILYGQDAFRAKVRANVTNGLMFQAWLNHNDQHTRYAYQVFRHGQSILRWDNAPHHPEQRLNFPHHFHDIYGQLTASPLSGNPVTDIAIVLEEIEKLTG